jgi:hypothetical protein
VIVAFCVCVESLVLVVVDAFSSSVEVAVSVCGGGGGGGVIFVLSVFVPTLPIVEGGSGWLGITLLDPTPRIGIAGGFGIIVVGGGIEITVVEVDTTVEVALSVPVFGMPGIVGSADPVVLVEIVVVFVSFETPCDEVELALSATFSSELLEL